MEQLNYCQLPGDTMNRFFSVFLAFVILYTPLAQASKVALCIAATGNYIDFASEFITSARTFFLPNHSVTYVLFSDSQINAPDVVCIYQKKEKWPLGTLMRFSMYEKQKEFLSEFDYVFAIDADMLCVNYVGDEILGERVATAHPAYTMRRRGSRPEFDSNTKSCVYIPESERDSPYFAGAFFGGSPAGFIHIIETCSQTIEQDLKNGIIAQYHDETHLNWYFRKFKPTKILTPSYCYPEDFYAKYFNLHKRFKKKICCLEKDHKAYQK